MRYLNKKKCILCGSDQWRKLPEPNEGRSITTACTIVNRSLGKAHCATCGVVQKIYEEFLGKSKFYEKEYHGYYNRPATAEYHRSRYINMVEWIREAIAPFIPESIIDVGCGQGGAMIAMQDAFPSSSIDGLEPSSINSTYIKNVGFTVFNKRLGSDVSLKRQYDLVYAIYVLQHVIDPIDFLIGIKNNMKKGGLAVIIVPNGNIPNIELLWSDQNYAFTANHLKNLAKKAGVEFLSIHPSPEGISTSWLILLGKSFSGSLANKGIEEPPVILESLFEKRVSYLMAFKKIDDYLCMQLKEKHRVINFGASFWTSILATYCPKYWKQVDFCTVDNGSGNILGKEVIDFRKIKINESDGMVLGLAKDPQIRLYTRFVNERMKPILWHKYIDW